MAAGSPSEAASQAAAAPETVDEVLNTIGNTLLGVWADFVGQLPFLAIGLLIVVVTWGLAFLARRSSRRLVGRRARDSFARVVERLVTIGVWGLGLLLAAMVVFPGVSPARAIGGLGLLSVAVGFAFKDTFENFFAGMLMLWRYPFESGDFIECGDILGRVEQINVRMTTIRKVSGELLLVPNAHLFQNPTQVLTDRATRRASIITGVAYGENLATALDVITACLEDCETVARSPAPQVFAHGFGSSSMDIEVAWWCEATPLGLRRSRSEVVVAIKAALDAAGIEIPFPYRTLTFKQPLALSGAGMDEAGASGAHNDE